MRFYDNGGIDPLISETVSFEELPKALNKLGSRSTYGKIITRPAE